MLIAGMFCSGPVTAQSVAWSGADALTGANTNWSDANNWTGGTPGPAANIFFFDTGSNANQGVVNNIVTNNTTISSLEYGNTNGFHTTQINAGITLTVSNTTAANLVFVGTGTDNGASQKLYSTMTGPGSLKVVGTNSGSVFSVQQGSASNGSHMATLDMSALANFNLTVGRLLVGGNGGSPGSSNWPSGRLYLAGTNTIRVNGVAPAIDLGDCFMNTGTNYLYLGQTNAIYADSITVARQKCTTTLAFNPSLSGSPVLYLAGNTNSQVTSLVIGDFSAQTGSGSTTFGTMNLFGGTVNAQINTCDVAVGQTGSGTGPTTGALDIGAGVFDVNTLDVGYVSVSSAVGNVTGTVTVSNGTLAVSGSLLLAYNPGATATSLGILNISNGTVLANSILDGGGTSEVKVSEGLLVVSNSMGTLASPLNSLIVDGGGTLQFFVTNNLTNAAVSSLSSDNSGAISISELPTVFAYPSQYPLIYCPGGGASGVKFSVGTLPGSYQGYVSNDNSSMIWLVITNGAALPRVDTWGGGVNANWDTSTLNWTNAGSAVAYSEGDSVLFNDQAHASTVNIVGSSRHTPFTWLVTNNVLNYVFTGTNSIGGAVNLIKTGTASLTLLETNDDFTGGIAISNGTFILDETTNAISGGLTIANGATVQIGNNDARGSLPSGAIADNGSLIFDQSTVDMVSATISGSGALTQEGSGVLALGNANTYIGNTFVLKGTLALTNSGSISSANVDVNQGTLDVSGMATPALNNLNMTNGAINVGAATLDVSALNMGGSGNTINVVALPGLLVYPTNVTLIQSSSSINGYNFTLGSLPAGSPSYAGSISHNGNAVVLTLSAGPLNTVQATVSFSPTNNGFALNPAFCGLSYEKSELQGTLFVSNDTSLVSMFGQIAPAVLRVGGNSVNRTCWNGLSNSPPITAADVDAFAGFVKALPTNWHVIYGINMATNTPANCAAEASYVANALGPRLLGFEIGNEPDLYYENTIRTSGYTFADFVAEWGTYAAAITNSVPGWAATNGGSGWTLTGPASAYNTAGYTVPFAADETGIISMLTQHYYRANGQDPSSTIEFLIQPDPSLPGIGSNCVAAATTANLPYGFRMGECGSYYNGGAPNVSDAYGSALWALDFMFTLAENGCQGINFHGGGNGTGYTPIADNGTSVVQARPEFYGLKMFSLAAQGGNVIPAIVTLASNINFTAYGVRQANGGISALLNNKATNVGVQVSITLGSYVSAAQAIELTGTNLSSTSGYTLGGATINPDGSWAGGVQSVTPATNGQLTFIVPPISAVLLNPVILPTNITTSLAGNQLSLSWPSNYTGWLLQSNSGSLLASNGWFTIPGSANTNHFQITIDHARTNVFYRIVTP